jgi:hypothetical protein
MENQNQKVFNELILELIKEVIKNQNEIIQLLKVNKVKRVKRVTFTQSKVRTIG